MLGKLQARMTYANVMSTLAVFLALGGGIAWALGRNDVKSKHIAPGAVKLSDTNDKLRLKCPGGTRYHEGACIETDSRPSAASWSDAHVDCTADARRLPTVAELLTFRLEPGITLSGIEGEWTTELSGDNDQFTVRENGDILATVFSNERPYRCAAGPKR